MRINLSVWNPICLSIFSNNVPKSIFVEYYYSKHGRRESMIKELTPKEVLYQFELKEMQFAERSEYSPEYDEVYKKIKSALEIDKEGYNVYFIDDFSKDKLNNIIKFIENIYSEKEKPRDICYVTDNDVKYPKALFLSNGKGRVLKETIEEIQNFYSENTFEFYNSSSNKEKESIIDNIQKRRNELIGKLSKMAEDSGFDIKATSSGFAFLPLKEGAVMTEKEYDGLEYDVKDDILGKVGKLKVSAQDILEELKTIELDEIEKLKKIMEEFFKAKLQDTKDEYYAEFEKDKEAVKYLDYICSEIEKEIINNYSINYDEDEEKINEIIFKYEVNVIVDNSENPSPRVIFEEDPSVNNLLGSIEYENHNGVYTTDVNLIKGGSMLKANEGCLIIRANSLFSNPSAYYYLKKALISERVDFDFNRGYLELLSLSGLKPEAISIKEKIIIIGDYETYDVLYNYDEDFKKVFKIRAEYKPIIDNNDENKKALVGSIYKTCKSNNLKKLTDEAVKEIAKFLSRKAESKRKFYYSDYELNKILMLSDNKVSSEMKEVIDGEDIVEVAYGQEIIEKDILDSYKDEKMLINVKDKIVGQVNGLSVIDTGYFSFGKPIRITCSCYKGDGNIIDVHKESNLSGSIHSKSVNILKGYMNRVLGGYAKIPVDFHLSFEQIYGKIDGDSASVAEIVSIISSLSKLPIKQNIAVTGSINQFGEVQPIGGVNEKVEGFFNTCKIIDNIEDKGVLIPYSNKDDLVLCKEVEDAINKGSFHIYTMKTVEDAIETLMGQNQVRSEEVFKEVQKEIKKYNSKRTN